MSLIHQLNCIIAERALLKHTFYQAWSNGTLSRDLLKQYAAQYYHQVESFPRFISQIHAKCRRNIKARQTLLQNLVDEELHGTDHPTLWMQFAEGIGVPRETVLNDLPIPETQAMVNKYEELAQRDWRDGLCALYAYEYQVPEVSISKIAGLKKHYNIHDEKTLEFFTAHQAYDVEHSSQVAKLIETYAEPECAVQATREAADALCGFLDGMCRVGHIIC